MGIYSDQIAARIKNDSDAFEKSCVTLASVVMGHKEDAANFLSDSLTSKNAIEEILKYFHVIPAELPADITDISEQMEFLLRPTGIMRRDVELTENWYKDGIGPLLGRLKGGQMVALLPRSTSGYTFFDYEQGKRVTITRKNCKLIESRAYCFYNPLPAKKLNIADVLVFMVRSLSVSDYISMALITLAATLIGLLTPYANQQLFGNVINSGNMTSLFAIAVLMIGVAVSSTLIIVTKSILTDRINTKLDISMQPAAMARLLSLPAHFFKDYSSGEITQRLQSFNSLCGILAQTILGTGLTSLFSLMYIGQIAVFAPTMAFPALIIIFVNIAYTVLSTLFSIKISKKRMESDAKLSGFVFSLFSGIQKIKLAGAERRAFSKWAGIYAKNAEYNFSPPCIIKFSPVISSVISMTGVIVLYAVAGTSGVSPADYMAFNVSYGMVSAAMSSLAGVAISFSTIKPILDMAKPLMEAEPEVSAGKKMLTRLSGAIEINNISFRYREDMPPVLNNLSLKISPGQYVAIVGASGCGKSTLLRLLLGFEQPQKGAIYYNGHDISSVDIKSLRKNIGCVIQNGKLMTASIYQNIILSAPWLTLRDAWEAAEMAGIADEIREMPMGMHTMMSEGSGGISGGQRQRIFIARAIAPKPKIVMLDEATSALDNITQKHISQSLDGLKCTRIVIAHRLSTIRRCDRIIMLENGRIAEDGTYDELMALDGRFAGLVERQRFDG